MTYVIECGYRDGMSFGARVPVSPGGAVAGGIAPTGARVYVKAGTVIAGGGVVAGAVVERLAQDLDQLPEAVREGIAQIAGEVLGEVFEHAVTGALDVTFDAMGQMLLAVLVVLATYHVRRSGGSGKKSSQ